MQSLDIEIKLLHPNATIPTYAHYNDAGADLTCIDDVEIDPGERALVPTGIALAIPDGYVGLVHPRSGLAVKHGVSMVNTPGTIDAGYRGEIKVLLINLDPREKVVLPAGTRIAQLVIQQVVTGKFSVVETLVETERGSGGFGSTG